MKKITLLLALLLCVSLLAACGQKEVTYTAEDVAGKTYTYEKDGCGGVFEINLFEDGTFQYYEGMLSSYIGMGTWTLDEHNVLCIKDQEVGRFSDDFSKIEMYGRINYFKVEEDCLVWMSEGSDNFLYVDVEDSGRFLGKPIEFNVSSLYRGTEQKMKELIDLDMVCFMSRLATGYSAEDRVGDLLEGFTCDDLVAAWGKPDSMTSGIWSYAWKLDESNAIWVVFDRDGSVSEVHLNMKE